jgi:hypothetical protein
MMMIFADRRNEAVERFNALKKVLPTVTDVRIEVDMHPRFFWSRFKFKKNLFERARQKIKS